jgi:hypothetical protein
MKTLFISLVAVLFAFFLGCQNSITDPVVPESTNIAGAVDEETFAYKDAVSLWPGLIKLDESICEPIHNTCNTTLIGGVLRYDIKGLPPRHRFIPTLKVGIYINAEFKSNLFETANTWRVYGMTEDIVYFSAAEQQFYNLDKEFLLTNTGDYRLKLVLKFKVYKNYLELVSMDLKNRGDVAIGDPEY